MASRSVIWMQPPPRSCILLDTISLLQYGFWPVDSCTHERQSRLQKTGIEARPTTSFVPLKQAGSRLPAINPL